MDGTGKMLVCAVGPNSQLGKSKLRLEEENEPTHLQLKLEAVAEQIGEGGTAVALLTLLALIVNMLINIFKG